jgi:MSHA biogenesis protein MshK
MKSLIFAAAVMLASAGTHAQSAGAQSSALSDPTRPPGAGAMQGAGVQDEAPAGRQLQSVLMSGGRKIAIIDGTMVPLGGMFGESRVVKISETEVVLKTGEETETLKLYPSAEKLPAKRAAGRARAAAPALQGGPK